jgi:succinate dehydrogenase/fumarate reductase flavoprotein subunit
MSRYDELLELAPRDVVSRSIVAEMRRTGTRTVYLDMTAHDETFLKERFPKIYETCKFYGLNIAEDLLPVSPASHYCMGGVRTDLHGRTTVADFTRRAKSPAPAFTAQTGWLQIRCLKAWFSARKPGNQHWKIQDSKF